MKSTPLTSPRSALLTTRTVNQCPHCALGRAAMPRAPWACKCGATGAGGNVHSNSIPKLPPNKPKPIYICKWEAGTSEEHEHSNGKSSGIGVCSVCNRCSICGLAQSYHTQGGAYECINALAKKVDELEGMSKVIQMVAASVMCRCGRPATEHQCGECYAI